MQHWPPSWVPIPPGLVPVPNATAGVNTALRNLEHQLEPGDEILVTSHGYNACSNAVAATAERVGAVVVSADVPFPPTGPGDVLESVLEAVNDRTKIAVLDHVTSPTALVFPLEELVAELEPDVTVIVDGAHAPGMVDVAIDDVGASYYSANCHKWICAPKGSGFLVTREDLRETTVPTFISHAWNRPWPGASRYQARFGWTGTHDPTAWLSVPAALEAMGELGGGWSGVMGPNHELVIRGASIVAGALGVNQRVPPSMIGSMVAVPLPTGVRAPAGFGSAAAVDPLTTYLRHQRRIEVPVVRDPTSDGAACRRLIRLSAQMYNTVADYERLADALMAVSV